MNDIELLSIVEQEERRALGWGDGELNQERETLLRYYNQEPYGNEIEGQSQIVTSEVADTVEWILPSLLKMFTASDKAVEFEPEGPEDEEGAKQATQACNYVFYRQNNGFLALYSFFKDALIQKNGYCEVYYEEKDRKKKETYRGLTDDEMTLLLQSEGVEVLAHSEYPDPQMPAPQPMAQAVGQALQAPVVRNLHDVQIEITKPYGKVCIDPIPPEETLVSVDHKSVDLNDCPFFATRRQRTLSELKEAGYDVDEIKFEGYESSAMNTSGEVLARRIYDEEELQSATENADKSMRKVWVTKAYIRVDYDGDGVAELRKVVKAAKTILENEECEVIPVSAITPIVMTHRHVGKSVAECMADLQLIKSTLMRQSLNNVYLTNNPRMAVLSNAQGATQANLDDLLTVRIGGIVREYQKEAVRPLTVPFMAQHGLTMMEYVDTVGDKRTGITASLSGVDADALNQTARGATILQNNAMQRIELVARIFAETGVKNLFKLILHCLTQYHKKELVVRLGKEFVTMDPRNWNHMMDMVINVGLGTGNKDQQLVHLNTIAQMQAAAIQYGMNQIVTPKNIYNVQAKIVENAGFKNVEDFWTDPDTAEPQPPKPDPKMVEAEQRIQLDRQKAADESQHRQAEMQADQQKNVAEHQLEIEKEKARLQLEREKATQQFALERWKAEQQFILEKWKAEQSAAHEVEKAKLSAHTAIEVAKLKPKPDDSGRRDQAR